MIALEILSTSLINIMTINGKIAYCKEVYLFIAHITSRRHITINDFFLLRISSCIEVTVLFLSVTVSLFAFRILYRPAISIHDSTIR